LSNIEQAIKEKYLDVNIQNNRKNIKISKITDELNNIAKKAKINIENMAKDEIKELDFNEYANHEIIVLKNAYHFIIDQKLL
jgi:hypothetical protein